MSVQGIESDPLELCQKHRPPCVISPKKKERKRRGSLLAKDECNESNFGHTMTLMQQLTYKLLFLKNTFRGEDKTKEKWEKGMRRKELDEGIHRDRTDVAKGGGECKG